MTKSNSDFKTRRLLNNAKKWVIGGGLFNCFAAFPFAMPFLSDAYINLFNKINIFLGLGGVSWEAPSAGANMLFLNTAGLALFLVGITLIYASREIAERIEIPFLNGVIRFFWSIIATYYIVMYEVIHIMFIIVVIDLILAMAFTYYYYQIKMIRESRS
ncbi:MAG: hypothetical protein P8179_23580 [Candidatus Thiodiazotropha sp.]|jgi:hypothetical protein